MSKKNIKRQNKSVIKSIRARLKKQVKSEMPILTKSQRKKLAKTVVKQLLKSWKANPSQKVKRILHKPWKRKPCGGCPALTGGICKCALKKLK